MILIKGSFFQLLIIMLLFALPLAGNAAGKPSGSIISIPYDHGNRIVYDLQSGIYNVFSDGQLRFSNVRADCQLSGKDVLFAKAISRTIQRSVINDGFGKGEKCVITIRFKGPTTVEQVFYTYPNRYFFLTQLILIGQQVSSNSMKPFFAHIPAVAGDARSLFVPFDNDTFISYNAQPFKSPFIGTSSEVGVKAPRVILSEVAPMKCSGEIEILQLQRSIYITSKK